MSKIRANQIETLDGLVTKDIADLVDQSDLDALDVSGAVQFVSTIADLQAVTSPAADTGYFVTNDVQSGLFYFDNSDLSSEVEADSPGGTYIAPSSDLTGASGAYVRDNFGLASVANYGLSEGEGETSGWSNLESDAETSAKTSGAPIVVTPEDVAFPNRAVKTWKRPAGIKDGAVAASFTLHPDETERTTQVTGHSDFNQIGSYAGRDSVALFFQNYATPPVVDTSSTTFTATSVSSPDFSSVTDEIKEGMIVDIGFPAGPWVGAVITSKTGTTTLNVEEWIVIDGNPTPTVATTPADGSNAKVNVFTGAWGINGNVRVQDGDSASKAVGFELGLICNKVGSGAGSTIFDAINLGGAEKPGIGYHARGGILTAFKQSGAGTGTGFNSQNADQGFLAEGSKVTSFRSVDPVGRHFSTVVNGSNKFTIENNGTCGNLYAANVNVSTSTTLPTDTTVALATASGITVTFPTATGKSGKMIFVRNASAGSITVDGSSLATGTGALYISDGSGWIKLMQGA
jgi:hypothetical protein